MKWWQPILYVGTTEVLAIWFWCIWYEFQAWKAERQ